MALSVAASDEPASGPSGARAKLTSEVESTVYIAIGAKKAPIHIAVHVRRHHRVIESRVEDRGVACRVDEFVGGERSWRV